MSDLKINNITNRGGDNGPIIAGVSTVSTSAFMIMPSGPTEFRGGRGRAIVFVGATPSNTTLIDAFNTTTAGNAFDFGDASAARYNNGFGGCASATRGVIADGTLMEYVVFSSGGGSNEFGDHRLMGGGTGNAAIGHAADGVRGLLAGGYIAPSNLSTIDFINIATTGNSSFFGEFDDGSTGGYTPMASPTRAVFARGGQNINYINFTTGGKTQIFGDMKGDSRTAHIASCSSSTRGIMAGGEAPSVVNTITYITLATLGNGTDFGDLLLVRNDHDASSSSTRGFIVAGANAPAKTNRIEFVTISTTGNAKDFGDLTQARTQPSSCSDVHGGLGD